MSEEGWKQTADNFRNPIDERRRMFELLGQETRHLIIQAILGHPLHLMSVAELDFMISNKTRGAIEDQLEVLCEENLLELYPHEPNKDKRDLPWQFYGFTIHGIDVLDSFNYLQGLPAQRALYDHTRKPERVRRHEEAPRPSLPAEIADAIEFDTPEVTEEELMADEDEEGGRPIDRVRGGSEDQPVPSKEWILEAEAEEKRCNKED